MCYDENKNPVPGHQVRTSGGLRDRFADIATTEAPQQDREISEEEKINALLGHTFPTPHTGPKFECIHEAARHFAKLILMNVPRGTDRYIAIQKIREVVFFANSGIAHDGLSL